MIWSDDTIAAIVTGLGEAGVGIVRISGPRAVEVGGRVFRVERGVPLAARRSHTVTYGWITGPDGALVDEALALLMRGPRSFTGEDVVELHSHGGQVAVQRVLNAVLLAGARLADPGEFTRRAFMNGRIDLSQAEAVIDIIRAKTDRAMESAVTHLRGGLREAIHTLRDKLLEVAAHLEADIDFPELELEVKAHNQVTETCEWCLTEVRRLLAGARQGKLLREGFRVVLAGRPNVGKSSLLNRLVRENRAIVTAIPGTTRDVIDEWISLQGIPVIVTDTAGIRETGDEVERLGVDRSKAMLERADLVCLVVDAAAGVDAEDRWIWDQIPSGTGRLVVANKADLAGGGTIEPFVAAFAGAKVLGVSAVTGEGLTELETAVAGEAGVADAEEGLLANARQAETLRRAAGHLEAALETRLMGFGSDLLSIDVRGAWLALGEVTGETVGDDLLDQIFSRFCIGK